MSHIIFDLAARRQGMANLEPIQHPAGVVLPFDGPADAALIIPEIRSEVRSGAYCAELLRLLPEAIAPGDRVLVIGAGLGVVSTMIARHEGVERVIAVEANTALIPYLTRVHALNGVAEVEIVNAVLAEGKKGRVPFFARRDLRTSSLLPHDRSWQQVMMVPFMNLNLILTEERISVIVCDIPVASAQLLAKAELGQVECILAGCGEDRAECWEDDGICTMLVARGYSPESSGDVVLFRREGAAGRTGRAGQESGPAAEAHDAEPEEEHMMLRNPEPEQEGTEPLDAEPEEDVTGPGEAEPEEDVTGPGEAEREDERRGRPGETPGGEEAAVAPGEAIRTELGKTAPPRRRRRRGRGRGGGKQADERRSGATGGGLAGRLWGLIALALFMALPLMLISAVAVDRAGRRAAVEQMIGATWGGAQTLTGPFLVVPVEATRTTRRRLADGTLETREEKVRVAPLVLLPETLRIDSFLNTEMRGGGSFEVPVYRSRHNIWLDIDPERIAGAGVAGLLAEGEVALWEETALGLGLSEPRALRGTLVLDGGGGRAGFQSGNFESGSGVESLTGVHARIGDPRGHAGGWRFTLELDGSRQFRLTPAARMTEARMRSDWPHPRFEGAFLPAWRQVGATGFAAEWSILQLAPSLPQASRGGASLHELEGASFGAALVQPVDLYITAQRAAKYGLLFIALSFGAIFLMGRSAARPPHLAQYALVGAAQCVFFLLLLSLAEQIGFAPAYALAAGATMALLTAYAWSALGLGRRSLRLTAALGLLYGAMYVILSTGEQALLAGAVLAFLTVAATMWGTRHEDWGAAFGALKREPRGPGPKG